MVYFLANRLSFRYPPLKTLNPPLKYVDPPQRIPNPPKTIVSPLLTILNRPIAGNPAVIRVIPIYFPDILQLVLCFRNLSSRILLASISVLCLPARPSSGGTHFRARGDAHLLHQDAGPPLMDGHHRGEIHLRGGGLRGGW